MANRHTTEIIERLRNQYPDAGTRLQFTSIFELMVAVVLSAQTTDEQVNRITRRLFDKYPSPATLAMADIDDLESIIRPVGIYRNKARNIKALAQMLLERYGGAVPEDMEKLILIPGVGRKSANVIISVGFNQPGLGVDTHVHRVANRLGLANCKKPEETELALKRQVPVDCWSLTHHLFIFHGRQTCRARKPDCSHCIVEELCEKHLGQ